MKFTLKNFLILIKFRIVVFVSISAILGYILANNSINFDLFFLWLGVFLLAGGSGALNQVQEWQLDSRMPRTMSRPIPQGVISPASGTIISGALIAIGLAVLFLSSEKSHPFFFGLLALIFYNVIYTPLKRITPFAAIPGAVIGAIPPLIGWTFAGGSIEHPQIFSISLFFFVWQIPHFWLLLIVYEKEYRNAGFPVLTDIFSSLQIARISFFWIFALVIIALIILAFIESFNLYSFIVVFLLGVLFLGRIYRMVKVIQPQNFYKIAFINLNIFVLIFSLVISVQKILKF